VDSAIVVAVIALIGALASGALSIYGTVRTTRMTIANDAERVLAKFREPLVDAAYELQSRLYNIIQLDFLRRYYLDGEEAEREYAIENTVYVVAQYFAWVEILRHEIQFLNFSELERTRAVADRLRAVVHAFQSDDPALGNEFRLWRGEQRAIGERMMVRNGDVVTCRGYAAFVEREDRTLTRFLARVRTDLAAMAATGPPPRVHELQRMLVALVRELDPHGVRYPNEVLQAPYPAA
jgi:hypothetical protein